MKFSIEYSICQNFNGNFVERVFQKTVPLENQVLEKFDKMIFKCSHLKEQNILSKMRGRLALHDFSFQSYKHQKNRKNHIFSRFDKLCNFLSFLLFITLERKVMESWATSHFAQNFLLFQMATFKNHFVKLL